MLMLCDLPHQRDAHSFRNSTQKLPPATQASGVNIHVPSRGTSLALVCMERPPAENLGLSCCYPDPLATLLSPPLGSFTLKISPSDLTYGTCEERIKFPQPLSTSYAYSVFLIVKLVIFCFVDQNSSPTTSSNIFPPCYMDLTNFESQMVFLPFITDNQLFCEFNFSRKNWNTYQNYNLGTSCVRIKLPEAPRT